MWEVDAGKRVGTEVVGAACCSEGRELASSGRLRETETKGRSYGDV